MRPLPMAGIGGRGREGDAGVRGEPADGATGPSGPSDLYVAMTRPTQRLVVVHARPLPAGVAPAPSDDARGAGA